MNAYQEESEDPPLVSTLNEGAATQINPSLNTVTNFGTAGESSHSAAIDQPHSLGEESKCEGATSKPKMKLANLDGLSCRRSSRSRAITQKASESTLPKKLFSFFIMLFFFFFLMQCLLHYVDNTASIHA